MSTNNFWTGSQILSKVQMSSTRLFILLAFLMSWSVVLSPSDLSRANASRNAFRENACCSALAILARSLQRLNSDVDDLFCAVAVTTTSTETFEGIFLTIQVALLLIFWKLRVNLELHSTLNSLLQVVRKGPRLTEMRSRLKSARAKKLQRLSLK